MASRPSDHTRAQKEGRLRDRGVCQICGSTSNIEGHHIIDYRFGGAADTNNIISLCHECHKDVHKGLLDLIVF